MTPPKLYDPLLPELRAQIPPIGVVTILGGEGSGKSAVGYGILESLQADGRQVLVLGLPADKRPLLPPFIKPFDSVELPDESIVLADEAHLLYYARESMTAQNRFIDSFIGLVRQKGILAIYVTQAGRKIELGLISASRVLLIKQPSLLQQRLERREIRDILKDATKAFKRVESGAHHVAVPPAELARAGKDTLVTPACLFSTYVLSENADRMIAPSNYLPSFWSTELSRAFRGVPLLPPADDDSDGQLIIPPQWRQRTRDVCVDLACSEPAAAVCICHGNGYCKTHVAGHNTGAA